MNSRSSSAMTGVTGPRTSFAHSTMSPKRVRFSRSASQSRSSSRPSASQPGRGRLVGHRVKDAGVEACRVRPDRSAPARARSSMRSSACASAARLGVGLDRQAGARQRRDGRDREPLEPLLPQLGQRQRAEPLAQPLAFRAGQQVVVRKERHRAAQRLDDLDLRAGVADVVLAADHVGDAEVDVVDHRGQRVEVGAVLADQHRVGHRGRVDGLRPLDQIVEVHRPAIELEAPMRLPALGLEPRASAPRSARARRGRRSAACPSRAPACACGRVRSRSRRPGRAAPRRSAGRAPHRRARCGRTAGPSSRARCRASRGPRRSPVRTPRSSARGRCRRAAGCRCPTAPARTAS